MEFFDVKGKKVAAPKKSVPWRPGVYGVLIERGKILLMRPDWDDVFMLPGGGIEFGETIEETVRREFLEETGYHVTLKDVRPLAIETRSFHDPKRCMSFH